MFELPPSSPDIGNSGATGVLRKNEKLSYYRQGLYGIRELAGDCLELRLIGGEFLLRVDSGSPEEYLRRIAGNKKRSFDLAKTVVMHAQSLIGKDEAPGVSFVNLHVSDFSKNFLGLLEEQKVDTAIAYEIVENRILSPRVVSVIGEMSGKGYKRIVIDDFPLTPLRGNHSMRNLEILERRGIEPYAVKFEGNGVRNVMDVTKNHKQIELAIAHIRRRFGENIKIVLEWVNPEDMQILSQIDPEILLQGRELDLAFSKGK